MSTCRQCSRDFQPKQQRPDRPAPLCCSRACANLLRSTAVTLTCRQCHREFRRRQYMTAWSQERGPFCGFDCYAAWQAAHVTGPKNPGFQPRSNRRAAGQWERNRLKALARDLHRCVRCSSTNRLHVHHKEPWQRGQLDPHALDNLETLCAACHRRSHPMKHAPDGKFLPDQETAASE